MENIEFVISPTVLIGVFVGGCVLLLFYILKLFRIEHEHEEKTKSDQSSIHQQAHSKKDKIKKKPIRDDHPSRNKQKFTSPWLLTSLKGHTGAVLNIDYSANGKYLATCGEEDPDPDKMSTSSSSSTFSSSSSDKENRHPRHGSSSEEPSPRTKGLSRRQRKNRKREDNNSSSSGESKPQNKKNNNKPQKSSPASSKTKVTTYHQVPFQPQGAFQMNLSDYVFMTFLSNFLLTDTQLYDYGYPLGNRKDVAVFFSYNPLSHRRRERELDVNAREFLPRTIFEASSSDASSSDDWSGSESEVFTRSRVAQKPSHGVERTCARCSRGFFITSTEYLTQERCIHHYGKLVYSSEHGTRLFSCCGSRAGTPGCTTAKLHVWSGVTEGVNGPYGGYVRTTTSQQKRKEAVYALDCEMCYTVAGLEVAKVTVVGTDGKCVYDSYVRPENEVVDYNTRYSGITKKHLEQHGCRSLKQVQRDLLAMIGAETVLIGHGLENDLRALKMIHKCVVDTAVVFPHGNGFPFRKSLKVLVETFLNREIQSGAAGHDSYEDAVACMELMVNKVCRDFMVPVFWTNTN